MTVPAQPEKKASPKTTIQGSAPRGQTSFALLDEKQWHYIQKHYRMSPRELQVARLVCQGFTNADVADKLNVKHGTIKTHLRSIFSKVRARNKISLLLRFVHAASIFDGASLGDVTVQHAEAENPIQKPPPPFGVY